MTFRIWCEVWGGVTGCRQAYLKQDGKLYEAAGRAAAEAEADRLNTRMNGPHAKASFRYTVVEIVKDWSRTDGPEAN